MPVQHFKKLKTIVMTLVKVNHPIQKSVNNIFDELLNEFPSFWGRDMKSSFGLPATNIAETTDAYHMELLVPGRNKEDFKIDVDRNILTISFETKEEAKTEDFKTVRKEFKLESFKRSFNLDDKINADAIQAKYENGLLKLLLPKQQTKEPAKQISIQ
jgi:HSP20 family protein